MLYGVCDRTGVEAIVQDLLTFLRRAGYAIREEVVIKVAILAEKHAPSFSWYVSVILTLIKIAGDFVSEEVWHRVLQVITNNPECQDHATKTCFEALLDPSCHEAMVKVGAYVLGEFGHLIANDPLSTPQKQLAILQQHYPMVSVETRSLLLSSYVKFAGLFPEMNGEVAAVLRSDNLTRSACAENNELLSQIQHGRKLLESDKKFLIDTDERIAAMQEKRLVVLEKIGTQEVNVAKLEADYAARLHLAAPAATAAPGLPPVLAGASP